MTIEIRKKGQMFKMKYLSCLETAVESYGVREQDRSNHFPSCRVHILNYASKKIFFSDLTLCLKEDIQITSGFLFALTQRTPHISKQQHKAPHRSHFSGCCWL